MIVRLRNSAVRISYLFALISNMLRTRTHIRIILLNPSAMFKLNPVLAAVGGRMYTRYAARLEVNSALSS